MKPTLGTLYLIPCTLGDSPADNVLPNHVINIARRISHFVVEHPKSARQFLSLLKHEQPIQNLAFETLNEHTVASELDALLSPLLSGHDVGIISEAGCPGVADPGATLVDLAHRRGIRVTPLVGPSSILLALMASGLNGQCFAFHGYLPIADDARKQAIQLLEKDSARLNQTQMFIETPYRNSKLFSALLTHCRPDTRICVATDISLKEESIHTRSVSEWKKAAQTPPDKHPALFLLLAPSVKKRN